MERERLVNNVSATTSVLSVKAEADFRFRGISGRGGLEHARGRGRSAD